MPGAGRQIALINQKGGVGKTTTTANLGAALAGAGRRVLLIDLDPQSHLTMHFGVDPSSDARPTIYEVLTEGRPLAEAVRPTAVQRVDLVPATLDFAAAEVELVGVVGREALLRDALARLVVGDESEPGPAGYDYLLLDCPPSLGLLTLNALSAAREVFICMQPHFLALQGVGKLLEAVALVHQRINPDLAVTGVVLCMYDMGTRLASEVVADLKAFLAEHRGGQTPWSSARVFETIVRRNIKLAECPSFGQVIFQYAPSSHGAEDYARLAGEVLAMEPAGEAVQPMSAEDGLPAVEAGPASPGDQPSVEPVGPVAAQPAAESRDEPPPPPPAAVCDGNSEAASSANAPDGNLSQADQPSPVAPVGQPGEEYQAV